MVVGSGAGGTQDARERRRIGLTAVLAVLVVVIGVLVLRSPGAEVQVGWFSYDGPPSPEALDGVLAWNLARSVGALLVLTGVLLVAHLLGVLVGCRSTTTALRRGSVLAVGGLLVVAGLVGFLLLTPGGADRRDAVVSISKVAPAPSITVGWDVWAPSQTGAVLVAAVGLTVVVGAVGLRRGARQGGRP